MKMSRQQTLPFTEDTSTCLQADSPASRSVSQARERARTITATYGQRCCEQFEKLRHVGLWAKTFSALLIGRTEWYSSRCNLIWKMLGTKCNRILFRLAPSMRPIAETGCGLLPTVRTTDSGGRGTVRDVEYRNGSYSRTNRKGVRFGVNLSDVLASGLLPTVKAQDCRHALHDRAKSNLGEEIAETFGDGTSQNSQLNPLFVAEMMGFPTDWTLAPFLNGPRSTNDGDSAAGGVKSQSKPTATP